MLAVFMSALVFISPLSVAAQTVSPSVSPIKTKAEIKEEIKNQRKEIKDQIEDMRKELKEKISSMREEIKISVGNGNKNSSLSAKIVQGDVTAISGTTLTVSKDGKTYTVNTDSNTKYRRHFWGKSSFSETSVGDKVNVQGKFTNDEKITILARLIRNTSIQKRKGVFFGTVTSKTSTSIVIDAAARGPQTIFFDSNTKFENRREESMTSAQVNVGDKIRVKGLWDKTLSKITEVTQVKDFTQPVISSVTVTSSPTP